MSIKTNYNPSSEMYFFHVGFLGDVTQKTVHGKSLNRNTNVVISTLKCANLCDETTYDSIS